MTVASRWTGLATVITVLLRLALGISFLSAVADRFGFWGVYGQPNVSWGNYARFVDYTAKLNWFLPAAMIPALAMIATVGETVLGLLLVLGWNTRIVALLSGGLLATFALTMTVALGVKAPLDFSVFSAAAGALCTQMPRSAWTKCFAGIGKRNEGSGRQRVRSIGYLQSLSPRMGLLVPSRSCPPRIRREAWPASSRWHWR